MFGRKREVQFVHEESCRFSDAQPEWSDDPRMGVRRRACVCGAESVPLTDDRLDPRTQSPEPAKAAHLHTCDCPGAGTAAVRVERNVRDGGWMSVCVVCDSTTLYWWAAAWDLPPGRDPVRVTRAGNILYSYATADAAMSGVR